MLWCLQEGAHICTNSSGDSKRDGRCSRKELTVMRPCLLPSHRTNGTWTEISQSRGHSALHSLLSVTCQGCHTHGLLADELPGRVRRMRMMTGWWLARLLSGNYGGMVGWRVVVVGGGVAGLISPQSLPFNCCPNERVSGHLESQSNAPCSDAFKTLSKSKAIPLTGLGGL
jgi:hypothetical protein